MNLPNLFYNTYPDFRTQVFKFCFNNFGLSVKPWIKNIEPLGPLISNHIGFALLAD